MNDRYRLYMIPVAGFKRPRMNDKYRLYMIPAAGDKIDPDIKALPIDLALGRQRIAGPFIWENLPYQPTGIAFFESPDERNKRKGFVKFMSSVLPDSLQPCTTLEVPFIDVTLTEE